MLKSCLEYYSLQHFPKISAAISKLQLLAQQYHPCGYKKQESFKISLSHDAIKQMLDLPSSNNINEVFRYAGTFGIITNVVSSPSHVEWEFNCYHNRDLFFTNLRLELRKQTKITSI